MTANSLSIAFEVYNSKVEKARESVEATGVERLVLDAPINAERIHLLIQIEDRIDKTGPLHLE